jgi:hypothetical protein
MSTEMILRTIDDVTSLAQIAIASKLTKLSRVEEAAVILMTGRELGLQPMQSLRGIYVVDGKPTLSADMMVAVIRGSGLCESWRIVESTAERCTITTRRKGEQHDASRTWTRADATLAGVASKDTWRKYPAIMLRHRCAADLARQEYPDVLLGLYDPEELGADAAAVQQPSAVSIAVATPTLPAPPTWATDLAACTTLRDVRACYARHAGTADHTGDAEPDDVREWCAEHNLIATAAEVTAILATLPDAALVILDDVHADEEHETTVRIERVARRVARERSAWDAHSAETTAKIVARSYAHATGLDLKAAGAALKRAITDNPDPEPPTGTDGPAREPGSDDGEGADPAGYEAHRAAQGEARAQVTELRVVREESSDPCVTSAAAWREHLAMERGTWGVRGAFRKRERAFAAEGVLHDREAATLRRLAELKESDPMGFLYCTTRREREALQRKDKAA